ncbi:MAG: site-specific integrase [Bacteroidales bacterium]|nr:site-specific integrase [Bacteroidales bacterium]
METDVKVRLVYNRKKNATLRTAPVPKTGVVEIVVSEGRKRRLTSTGIKLYLDQWKDGMVVNHVDAADMNIKLRRLYEEAVQSVNDMGLAAVADAQMGKKDFCDWMQEQIEDRTDIAEITRSAHLRTVAYLRESGLFRRFSDLTERNITLWDQQLKKRLNKQSAVHGYHKRLKTYISRAMHLGLLKESPYRFVRVPKGKSDGIKYLTPEERDRVEALELTGTLAVVRDMFIFACYTGLAYCDLVRVKDCVVQERGAWIIDSSRLKTNVRYKLKVLPKALEILERYDFDLNLMSNQKCNMNLKAIQAMAKIQTNMSMHVGRHTFATWALSMGVPLPVVSKMLAHTNIVTTQIYARVLQTEVEKGFDTLMGC